MSGAQNYQPVQQRIDIDTRPFVLEGHPKNLFNAIFEQDGGRSGDLVPFTLLSKIAANGKFTSYTDETATDGTAEPAGIYLGPTIAEADIQGADIELVAILTDNATFDDTRLIIENSKLLTTIIATGTVNARTVGDELRKRQLIPVSTLNRSGVEN